MNDSGPRFPVGDWIVEDGSRLEIVDVVVSGPEPVYILDDGRSELARNHDDLVDLGFIPKEQEPFIRVHSDFQCYRCSREAWRHPHDLQVIGYGDRPFLRVLCDGTRVKL